MGYYKALHFINDINKQFILLKDNFNQGHFWISFWQTYCFNKLIFNSKRVIFIILSKSNGTTVDKKLLLTGTSKSILLFYFFEL